LAAFIFIPPIVHQPHQNGHWPNNIVIENPEQEIKQINFFIALTNFITRANVNKKVIKIKFLF